MIDSCEPGVEMIITLRYYEIFYTGIINRGRLPVTIGLTAGKTDILTGLSYFWRLCDD